LIVRQKISHGRIPFSQASDMGRGKPVPTRFPAFEAEPQTQKTHAEIRASPARGNVMTVTARNAPSSEILLEARARVKPAHQRDEE
jgi:hypothetical protein